VRSAHNSYQLSPKLKVNTSSILQTHSALSIALTSHIPLLNNPTSSSVESGDHSILLGMSQKENL
jgi:hypothetical protein